MYLCVYVCVCVCMCVCVYVCVSMYVCICMYTCMYVCMYAYMYVCLQRYRYTVHRLSMHVFTPITVYVCVRIHAHTRTHKHTHAQARARAHTHTHARTHTRTHARIFLPLISRLLKNFTRCRHQVNYSYMTWRHESRDQRRRSKKVCSSSSILSEQLCHMWTGEHRNKYYHLLSFIYHSAQRQTSGSHLIDWLSNSMTFYHLKYI